MAAAFGAPPLDGIAAMASGDLFLEDVRAYREERLTAAGKDALFPLWGRDTRALANEFVEAGFEAFVCCLDPDKLDPSFAGRSYDAEFLADLPEGSTPAASAASSTRSSTPGLFSQRRWTSESATWSSGTGSSSAISLRATDRAAPASTRPSRT